MMLLLQVRGAVPTTPWELIMASSVATWVVLIVLMLFSVLSWFLIVLKWAQFRRVRKQGNRFFNELERTTRLEEAYHAVMKLPPSPYGRLLREGVYLSMDRYPSGLTIKVDWRQRNATVKALIDRGWADRLMVGHDYAPAPYLAGRDGPEPDKPTRYLFLSKTALPALAADGVDEATIHKLTVDNPRRFLAGGS